MLNLMIGIVVGSIPLLFYYFYVSSNCSSMLSYTPSISYYRHHHCYYNYNYYDYDSHYDYGYGYECDCYY